MGSTLIPVVTTVEFPVPHTIPTIVMQFILGSPNCITNDKNYNTYSSKLSFMNQVISIRVPEETRSEMKKLRQVINWNLEIRAFIQKRIDDKKKDDVLTSVTKHLQKNPTLPSGSAAHLVRTDRDSH